MMTYITRFLLITFFVVPAVFGANLPALKKLFIDNFDNYYEERLCGKNTARFISEAKKLNIDLSNSYVLKVVGAGFLETSGFYTRKGINQRHMLGYFHMVFVADNYVFDFDLDEPLVLKLQDYVRLQFTPPYEPFRVIGIDYRAKEQLPFWTATSFEWSSYIKGKEVKNWTKSFSDFLKIDQILKLKRIR